MGARRVVSYAHDRVGRMRRRLSIAGAVLVLGCGDASDGAGQATESNASDGSGASGQPDDDGDGDGDGEDDGDGSGATEGADGTGPTSDGSDDGDDTTGGELVECDPTTTGADAPPPDDHGFATEPPKMALADAFYGYDVRTRIGDCSTDLVRWTF